MASRPSASLPAPGGAAAPIVIISAVQDFRLKRRGSLRAVAEELGRCGKEVTFVSALFSGLSHQSADPRMALLDRASRVEIHGGVKCYLWRTPFHPFDAERRSLDMLAAPLLHLYAWYPNAELDVILRAAGTIVIEAGLAVALLPRIRRLNPGARLIYRASDRPSAIGQHAALASILRRHQAAIDAFCLSEPGIATDFAWAFPKVFVVPSALDQRALDAPSDNPQAEPIEAMPRSAVPFDASLLARADLGRIGSAPLSWSEIVPRLLAPRTFADTQLTGPADEVGTRPALSLIVATRGRVEPLARLLTSLRQQPRGLFEVIVVDQNDPGVLDGLLRRFSEALDLVHLRSAPGLSLARNVGLAASRGRLVGFPDDDCWYPAGRVADVLRFFGIYEAVDVLLGQTVDAQGTASVNAVRAASEVVTPANVWFSGNSNTLFMRQPLATRLRFDEGLGVGAQTPFQSGEETDLILRALKQGAKAVYCPNLTIHHDQVDGVIGRAQLRRAWRYSTGFGQVLRRHYGPSYLAYRLARSVFSAALALLFGNPKKSIERVVWGSGTLYGSSMSRSPKT